jgi:bacteriocin-like protein
MKNDPATKPAPKELSASELENVTGGKGEGKASFNPFSITRKVDRSSPIL